MSDTPDFGAPDDGAFVDPFITAVSRFTSRARELQLEALRATALDLLARVKELTPVDTGNLRANWTVIAAGTVMPVIGQVPSPEEAVARLQLGDVLVLANPVIYARRIEFGFVGEDSAGHHYNQPGKGMMTQALAELPEIARRATARVIGEST